jgi:hypothetical protein
MQVKFEDAIAQAMCRMLLQLPSFSGAEFRRLLDLLRVAQQIPEYLSMLIRKANSEYKIYSHQFGHAGASTSFPLHPFRIWQILLAL